MTILLKEALFYDRLEGGKVLCALCPRKCVLKDGQRGFCGVRENRGGTLYTLNYGLVSAFAVDPVEKKPLFHFYPGSPILSISTVGCNFECPWCQNYDISRGRPEDAGGESLSPEYIVDYAKRRSIPLIAYTYNEPLIWYEYVLDTSKLAKREGIANVLVTNGYVNLEPLAELLPFIDAANVDIKAFDPSVYARYPKGKLESVLEAVVAMKSKGIHVETTYLLVPTVNDSDDQIRSMAKWHMDALGPDTPLHVSRFFPMYKFTHVSSTPIHSLEKAWQIAKDQGLRYVYVGNLPGNKGEHTYCPSCGALLIERFGFQILSWKLDRENKCSECGEKIPIRGSRWSG